MRFSRIEIHSAGRLRATLNLSELQHETPYAIKAMSGLDVPETTSRFYGFSLVGDDGARVPLFEPVLPDREIAVRIGYRPNYANYGSRSDLRDELYRLLGSSRTNRVELRFFNEAQSLMYIRGSVAKIEPSLFSEESEVILTFECDDPIFRGFEEIEVVNPTTTVASLVRTLEINDSTSTFQHGVLLELVIAGTIEKLYVYNDQGDNTSLMTVDVSSKFVLNGVNYQTLILNDVVKIDTRTKLPQVTVTRGAYSASLLDKVVMDSIWPVMHDGANVFRFAAKYGLIDSTPPTVSKYAWLPHFAGV